MTVTSATSLLIDAGNTRLKWALLTDGQLRHVGSVPLAGEDLGQRLQHAWREFALPSRLLLANVGGERIVQAINDCFESLPSNQPALIQVQAEAEGYGVRNAYDVPQKLGVDRWLGLVAARRRLTGAACVVDCGTAITVDIVNSRGDHLGGVILPGLRVMLQSLTTHTAIPRAMFSDIPMFNAADVSSGLLGTDTRSAVAGGILAAASGAIVQVIREAERIDEQTLTVILTGGDAPCLQPHLPMTSRLEPDWVLQGLRVIAEALP